MDGRELFIAVRKVTIDVLLLLYIGGSALGLRCFGHIWDRLCRAPVLFPSSRLYDLR
jgi:hypothetical protein